MYEVLLAVHLLCAVTWAGGSVSLHVLGRRAVKRGRGSALAWAREAQWLGSRIFGPIAFVLLLAGILLVGEVGYEHSQAWISIAYAGWLVLAIIGGGVYPRLSMRLEEAASKHGEESDEAAAFVSRIVTVSTVELTILLLIVVDMAFKPGL